MHFSEISFLLLCYCSNLQLRHGQLQTTTLLLVQSTLYALNLSAVQFQTLTIPVTVHQSLMVKMEFSGR